LIWLSVKSGDRSHVGLTLNEADGMHLLLLS
jgi:hypothetical protein